MSQIILKESFRHFIILGAAVILATIFSCYAIAVLLGHVPVWLPMISDCGVHAPEKYFFSYGLVTGSVLICAESLLLYHAEGKTFSHSRLCLITSFTAAVGMGVVGVVNEKENIKIHAIAAMVAFLGYLVFMTVLTYFSKSEPSIGRISMAIKKVCTALGWIAVGVSVISSIVFFSILGEKPVIGKLPPLLALCEWVIMSSIMVFNISFYADVGGIYLCEVNEKLKKQAD